MKKLIAVVLIALLLVGCMSVFAGCTPREDTLKILNWAEYIDEELCDAFVKHISDTEDGRTIKIRYTPVETNEEMYTKIKRNRDFDIVCPSDYMIAKMISENLLNEVDFANIPNAENTSAFVKDLYKQYQSVDIGKYAVGYTWGTMGIIYNPDLIKETLGYTDAQVEELVSSWNALWAKDPSGQTIDGLKNKLTFKNSIRDNYFVASTYVNGDASLANNISAANITKVKEALIAQKAVSKFWEVDLTRDEIIDKERNILLGLQWAGDAQYSISEAAKNNMTLKYSVPKEGSNVFFDGWVIPKSAKNQSLAEKFLNFMCDVDNAAQNMQYIGYSSTIITEEFFDNDFIKAGGILTDVSYFLGLSTPVMKVVNPTYYPSLEVLNNCVVMLDFGDAYRDVNKMWNEVKSK